MQKESILFYTDCFIFGGSEKPLFEFITSQEFSSLYDYFLIYRDSKGYREGLFSTFPNIRPEKTKGILLFHSDTLDTFMQKKKPEGILFILEGILTTVILDLLLPIFFFFELILLYFLFIRGKSRVIHINNGGYPGAFSCRVAVIAAKLARKKYIILNVHNMALASKGIFERIIDFFVSRCVSIIITGSKAAGKELVSKRGFSHSKIQNICHGISSGNFAKLNMPDMAAQNGNYIAMVARFEERKGHRYVISAFKKILFEHPEYSNLNLVLIGDGYLFKDIKALVEKENITRNVIFLGFRSDYLNYIAASLFLLNPSVGYEDLPVCIIEAMSLGVPVIGTNVAGIPEEIEDGVTGIIIPPADIEALVSAMLSLLSNNEMRVKMGIAAKRRFDELFRIERMIDNYMNLYKRLLHV